MDETMINPTISPLGSISPHAIFSSSPPSQPNRHHLVRRMYSDQQPLSASIPLPKSHIHRTHSELQLAEDVQRARRWSAFEMIVLANPAVYRAICEAMSSLSDTCCEGVALPLYPTLLHACLPCSPPPEIVLKMIDMSSSSDHRAGGGGWPLLRARDRAGRTPLHVAAAARGADAVDPIVIKLLGNLDPTTCSALDERGRTPLHLACESSRDGPPSYGAVRALLSESIWPASIEDDDGMSPLEHAILSNASADVVVLLQKATVLSHQERDGRPINMAESSNPNHKRKSPEAAVVPTTGIHEERI